MCYNGPNQMRDFVDTLPLRLAAGVGALVGVIGLVRGVDLWVSAGRVGAAFVVVLLGALGVRRLLLTLLENARRADSEPPDTVAQAGLSDDEPPSTSSPTATTPVTDSQNRI